MLLVGDMVRLPDGLALYGTIISLGIGMPMSCRESTHEKAKGCKFCFKQIEKYSIKLAFGLWSNDH